jgi:hypothetical protein
MNPSFNKFKSIITRPILLKFFLFLKLSSAFFAGLSIQHFDAETCVVRIKLSWFNQNPFRSMYFAVEAMAAEMCSGMLALSQVYQRSPKISMLVEGMEAKFLKKATGVILFSCDQGKEIEMAVEEAIKTGESTKITCLSTGKNSDGIVVAEFNMHWTFKVKN